MNPARQVIVALVGVALCITAAVRTREPGISAEQRAELGNRFAFATTPLNGDLPNPRTVRRVNPALRHIDGWISAVGAAVALADVDGDGLPNDRCVVDPRDDSVTVAPIPGTGDRYHSFSLTPGPLAYNWRTMAPMGCVPYDYNEDGLSDILTYYWGRSPVLFLRRHRVPLNATAFRPADLVTPPEIWNTTTLNVADVDGDGHPDILVGNYYADGARVLDPNASRDRGVRMQNSMSNARNGGSNRILLWRSPPATDPATPQYREAVGAFTGHVARSWTLAIGAQDLNRDGLPELYYANDFGSDDLLLNESSPGLVRLRLVRGRRGFAMPKSKVLGRDSFKGMGVTFPDLNADTVPDIVVSNITERYALQESNFAFVSHPGVATDLARGVAPYTDRSEELGLSRSGWAWDVKAGDFDNRGDPELVQATGFLRGRVNRWPQLQELAMSNDGPVTGPAHWPRFRPGDDLSGRDRVRFWGRAPSGRFADLAARIGVTTGAVSRAIALGDVDGDGRLDIAIGNQWARSMFLHNRAQVRPFLGLRLRVPVATTKATRPAVGAAVEVTRTDGRRLVEQMYPANGHTGVSAPDLLFGLGDSPPGAVDVRVQWRDTGGLHVARIRLAPGWHTLTLWATRLRST